MCTQRYGRKISRLSGEGDEDICLCGAGSAGRGSEGGGGTASLAQPARGGPLTLPRVPVYWPWGNLTNDHKPGASKWHKSILSQLLQPEIQNQGGGRAVPPLEPPQGSLLPLPSSRAPGVLGGGSLTPVSAHSSYGLSLLCVSLLCISSKDTCHRI